MSAILKLEHVQLEMPVGAEETARRFYSGVLGMQEISKPATLGSAIWFAIGDDELHVAPVDDARAPRKGHVAIRVLGLAHLAERCASAGFDVEHDTRYPERSRFYVRDPFGNRLELFQLDADAAIERGAQPTLETDRLVLRAFRSSDAAAVQQFAGAREVAEMTLNIPHPYPDGAAAGWIASLRQGWASGQKATFAIVERETDALVGCIGLVLEPRHARAEIGYWIGVPYWGRGYATEAGRAMLTFAFDVLGLHRVSATHYPRNPASGRVMEKLGMQREGVHRGEVLKDGTFEDIAHYAVVAGDVRV